MLEAQEDQQQDQTRDHIHLLTVLLQDQLVQVDHLQDPTVHLVDHLQDLMVRQADHLQDQLVRADLLQQDLLQQDLQAADLLVQSEAVEVLEVEETKLFDLRNKNLILRWVDMKISTPFL